MSGPIRENFGLRWKATSPAWRAALFVCLIGTFGTLYPAPFAPSPLMATIRSLFFAGLVVAVIANKRVADTFYARVYAEASVFCVGTSAIVLFTLSEVAFDVRPPSLLVALA